MAKDQRSDFAALRLGGLVARLAEDCDLRRSQALRHTCFYGTDGVDKDAFDALCDHVIVEDQSGSIRCSYRLMHMSSGAELDRSYAAQYYDLSPLSQQPGPMIELGRFCIAADCPDPDVLRLAWGMLAAIVDARGVQVLFGCSSFAGADPAHHRTALNLLAARHLGPLDMRPGRGDAVQYDFAANARPVTDLRAAMAEMPSLLRTSLAMGGWVSDHAVIDHQMDTVHVFTGLEIAAIPPARARALRAVAGLAAF